MGPNENFIVLSIVPTKRNIKARSLSQLYETGCSEIFFFFCLYTQTKGQVHQSQQQTVEIGNVLLNFPKTELPPSSHLTHSQWFLFLAKNKTQKVEVLNDIKELFFLWG